LNEYDASAEYVENLLRGTNYFKLSRQYFPAPVWKMEAASMAVSPTGSTNGYIELDGGFPLQGSSGKDFVPFR
jgi:hypothetical protein